MTLEEYLRERLEYHLPEEQGKGELIALLLPLLAMGARPGAATWQGLREGVAQAVVLALKDDAERHWRISWDGSLERANQIIAVGEARTDLAIQALGMMAKADAIKIVTGRLGEAWELLDYAGRLYRMSHLPENEREIGWARTRIGRVYICAEVGKIEQGFAEAEQAREILEREKVWGRLIFLHNSWARAFDTLNELDPALKHYRSALAIAQRLGDEGVSYLPTLYANMAMAQRWLEDWDAAVSSYEWCIQWLKEHEELGAVALTQQNLAESYLERGWYGKSLRLLQEVEPILRERYPRAWVNTLCNLLHCYTRLNHLREARFVAQQILSAETDSHTDTLQMYSALIVLELGSSESHLLPSMLGEMTKHATLLASKEWLAETHLYGALFDLQHHKFEKARAVAKHVVQDCLENKQLYLASKANWIFAKATLAQGDFKEAYKIGQESGKWARRERNLSYQYQAHMVMGDASYQGGMVPRAKRHYQAAVTASRLLRERLSYGLSADGMMNYQEGLHKLMRLELDREAFEKAFVELESHKSRLFLGYLQRSNRLKWVQTPQTIPLLEEYQRLRSELVRLGRNINDQPRNSVHRKSIEGRLRQIVERLYLYTLDDLPFWVKPVNLRTIQLHLLPKEVLIAYYSNGVDIWLFVVSDTEIKAHLLPCSYAEIEELLAQVYEHQEQTLLTYLPDAPQTIIQARKARQLYAKLGSLLLEPIANDIGQIEHLCIVPYGNLHAMPFNLLRIANAYLIEHSEITILPTAGLLSSTKVVAPAGKHWVGHSNHGELPYAVAEVVSLQQRWGGTLTIEGDALLETLSRNACQILHLSTHGVHRVDEHFDLSYIQLEDGDLYGDDILQRDMGYELVTLSACETGRAVIAPGEEVIGLGRAFLYAGAGSVVASLWQVHEEWSLRLMTSFYNALFRGAPRSTALRQAQLSILQETPMAHPVFWGAYQLIGQKEPLSAYF